MEKNKTGAMEKHKTGAMEISWWVTNMHMNVRWLGLSGEDKSM